MSVLALHSLCSAPERSQRLLKSSIEKFGWIPNQSAYMAESPSLLEAYQRAHELFNDSSFDEAEKTVVWIAAGRLFGCAYTVRAHNYIARANGVPEDLADTLVDGRDELPPRLASLSIFTQHVASCQGRVDADRVMAFLQAGFTPQNVLDVILGVSQKMMSTLLNSVAETEIDTRFSDGEARDHRVQQCST